MALCSVDDVKQALGIEDTVDDYAINLAVEASTAMIQQYCGRQFTQDDTATARVYVATNPYLAHVDDISTTSGLIIKTDPGADGSFTQTWTASDYQLEPLNGVQAGQVWPYTRIRARENFLFPVENELALVKVTGVWGWPAIPKAIEFACILQSQRFFKRFDSPTGVIGFGDMGAIRVARNLDPDIAQSIDQYRKDGYGIA